MSDSTIFKMMLQGCTLKKRFNRRKTHSHCLYQGNAPVKQISFSTFTRIEPLLKEKKGTYTLNLNTVRQQHGLHAAKKFYKQLKAKNNGTRSNKPGQGVQVHKKRPNSQPTGSQQGVHGTGGDSVLF